MSVGGGFINQRMSQEDRKKEIRQAAMKVFLDKGFRNTVMNDIMEATGLSRGGLYHHYGSTYEILYDIMVEGNLNRRDIIQKSIYDEGLILSPKLFSRMIIDKILADNDYVKLYVTEMIETYFTNVMKKDDERS